MTQSEVEQLDRLGSTYGPIPVLAGLQQFCYRPEGFVNLLKPFAVFVREADQWIDRAYKEASDFARWPNGQRFLSALNEAAPDVLNENVKQLLFHLWAENEELLNRDTLALLVSEQMSREPAAVSA